MDKQNSESLLTQILYLVQELHNDMSVYNQRLTQCEETTRDLQLRLQALISDAFPGGAVIEHRVWHENRNVGPVRRYLIKLLT